MNSIEDVLKNIFVGLIGVGLMLAKSATIIFLLLIVLIWFLLLFGYTGVIESTRRFINQRKERE